MPSCLARTRGTQLVAAHCIFTPRRSSQSRLLRRFLLSLFYLRPTGKHVPGGLQSVEHRFCPFNGRFQFSYMTQSKEFRCEGEQSELSNCPHGNALGVKFRQCTFPNMGKRVGSSRRFKQTIFSAVITRADHLWLSWQTCTFSVWATGTRTHLEIATSRSWICEKILKRGPSIAAG